MKVFVVDDDPLMLSVVGFILNNEGFDVQYAQPPLKDSFYKDIEEFNPDVILLDIYLGEYTRAEEVAKGIREKTTLITTPIVAMSSSELIEDKMKVFVSGFVDYINKPFTKKKLVEVITRHAKFNELICLCRKVIDRSVA